MSKKNAVSFETALMKALCLTLGLFECRFGFRNCLGHAGNDLVRVAL